MYLLLINYKDKNDGEKNMKKSKLTIAVITMNRADQLMEALDSCIQSTIPQNTEFVIIDNASTDNTKEVVNNFIIKNNNILVKYRYSPKNLGVGGGRSLAFSLSEGEYVYFLDDDAIIADDCKETFFADTINYLDNNKSVASLTTRIYDEMLVMDRTIEKSGEKKVGGLPIVYKYLGGSHFLRKDYFDEPLYFDLEYGSEEYAPSIKVQDRGFYNVFKNDVYIIHKPKINKWIKGTNADEFVNIRGCAVPYATKKLLYPKIFLPILWIGYNRRCKKYLKVYINAKKKTNLMVKEITKNNKCKKIKIKTVINMFKEFGLTVF